MIALFIATILGAIPAASKAKWSWAPELSSVLVHGDSVLEIQYVIRIQAGRDGFFGTLNPATMKQSGTEITCRKCQPYMADSIVISAIDSQGVEIGRSVDPFGYAMAIKKNGWLVLLRSTSMLFKGRGLSAFRFSYKYDPRVPIFNSTDVPPNEDYSRWFKEIELPYETFQDDP